MSDNPIQPKTSPAYIAVSGFAVLLSWILHELSHWIAGEWLGYDMVMTLNSGYPVSRQYSQDLHYQLISAAGPVFTLVEALFIFVLMKKSRCVWLYPFLFTCFYMRLFATVISFRRPNDEARISTALGIGKFTLPILMTIVLFLMLCNISKTYGFKPKFNLLNLALVILFSSLIILADMYFKVRLL